MTTLREAAQQALEALSLALSDVDWRADSPTQPVIHKAHAALHAALAQPAPHGCHVDLDYGMKPDGCVLDDGRPESCIYAKRLLREGKDKTACEYWQPIEVTR